MFNIIPWEHSDNLKIRKNRNPFFSLQSEINRVFDDFLNDFQETSLLTSSWNNNQSIIPVIDIIETDKSFKVEAELPGMKQEDVEVTVNNNYLNIKGEKKASKEDKDVNYVRKERYYGSYKRTIVLPETADADKAKASFKKGVLWIEVPKKAEAAKPARKVEIKKAA